MSTSVFSDLNRSTCFIQRPNTVLSDQKKTIESAELPLPLYTALNVLETVSEAVYHGKKKMFSLLKIGKIELFLSIYLSICLSIYLSILFT